MAAQLSRRAGACLEGRRQPASNSRSNRPRSGARAERVRGEAVASPVSWHRRGRRGGRPARTGLRRAAAGCSFVSGRGLPASSTLRPKAGVMQPWRAVRTIRAAAVPSRGTAPTPARRRPARGSRAGTVPRATPPSACCRTAWRRGCRARSPGNNTLSVGCQRPHRHYWKPSWNIQCSHVSNLARLKLLRALAPDEVTDG